MTMNNEQWTIKGRKEMLGENIVAEKALEFAVRVVKLYQYLKRDKAEGVMSQQLLRSGTSIGANVAEAEYGISKKDFQAKMYIALKECAETLYWLELLHSCTYLSQKEYNSLYNDCDELRKILSSITKTIKTKGDE